MILIHFILYVLFGIIVCSLGSRVRKLDQMELGPGDYNRLRGDHNRDVYLDKISHESLISVKSPESCNSESNVESYVKRYVNTFMRHTDFKNVDTSNMGSEDFIYGSMTIRIKAGHLEELKKFYFEERHISLSDLDTYLCEMFYKSHYDEFEGTMSKFFKIPIAILSFFVNAFNFIIYCYILVALVVLFSWYKYGLKFAFLVLVIGMVTVDAIQSYIIAIKKAEIEQFRRMKKLRNISPSCDPSTYSYFRFFRNLIWEDECQQLLEDLEIHHAVHISFPRHLSTSFLHIFFHLPIERIGLMSSSIGSTIGNDNWLAWLIKPVVSILVFVIILCFVLTMMGARLQFSNWIFGSVFVGFPSGNFINNAHREQPNVETNRQQQLTETAAVPPNFNVNITVLNQQPNGVSAATGSRLGTADSIVFQQNDMLTYSNSTPNCSSSNDNYSLERHNSREVVPCGCSVKQITASNETLSNTEVIKYGINRKSMSTDKIDNNTNNQQVDHLASVTEEEQLSDKENKPKGKNIKKKKRKGKKGEIEKCNDEVNNKIDKVNSNINEEKSGLKNVSINKLNVTKGEEVELVERSIEDITLTDTFSNTSSDSCDMDLGAEVASIKIGLRSLIEEDDCEIID